MKPITLSLALITIITLGACNLFKRSGPKAPPAPPAPPTAVVAPAPPVAPPAVAPTFVPRIAPSVRSTDGIFAPGDAELLALQPTHKEATMQTLREGYALYTGVCTNCHMAKSIYSRPEAAWPGILTSMATEARITEAQKDAIYQYVLAIKATQPRK